MNQRLTAWYVIGMLFAVLSCSESAETRVQRFLGRGNDMVRKRNYEEAIGFYKEALKIDSCFVDALNNLGTLSFDNRDYEAAIQYYSKAISCNAQYLPSYLNRANAYYESNELFSGLRDLETVEKSKPDTVMLHFIRGLIYTRMANYERAQKSFEKSIALDRANAELKINLASVLFYRHRYDSAKAILQSLIDDQGVNPNAFNTLALISVADRQYDSAMFWVEKALAKQRNNPFFLNNRGYIYLLMGNLSSAISDINESISIDPYNGWAYRNKGIYYLKSSKPDDALRVLTQAKQLDDKIDSLDYYLTQANALVEKRSR